MTEAQSDKFLSTIEFSHFQVEAFHKDASKTFSEGEYIYFLKIKNY